MAFRDALRFPFRGERRWTNLGFALLCFLIPIVGPMVLLGYGVLVEKTLIADLDAVPPDLDFSNFMAHLKRGIAPLVVGLIFVPVIIVAILPIVGLLAFGMIEFKRNNNPVIFGIIIASAMLAELVLIAMANLVITPVAMKAGLEQTIGGAFNWKFLTSFIKRVGLRALGYNMLLMAISTLLMPFALCCFIVGAYAATAWLMFVQFHIRAQLYRLYVDRGGVPLIIRNDDQLNAFQPLMYDDKTTPS